MRYPLFALAPLLTLLAAACGDDGEAPEDTPTPSPAAEAPTRTPPRTATASPTPKPVETLAFLRDGEVWLINADGSGERRLTTLGNLQSFSWLSSTELYLVIGEERLRHAVVELSGSVRELSFPRAGPAVDVGPYDFIVEGSWSPDGIRYVTPIDEELIVFDRDGAETARLPVRIPLKEQAEKSECAVNVPHRLVLGPPVFAPHGRDILVAVYCDVGLQATNQPATLYRVSLEGGIADPLGLSTNLQAIGSPRFSPDGLQLAETRFDRFGVCHGETTLFVADGGGGNARQLTLPEIEELHRRSPVPQFRAEVGYDWSPESDAVVATFNVFVCDPTVEQIVSGLYIFNFDGSAEKLPGGPATSPAWSPSGQFIAYVVPGDTPSILLFDLTTRQTTELTQGTGPAWQPQP